LRLEGQSREISDGVYEEEPLFFEGEHDVSQEPMIKLDPNGVAPILSYNIPEPTSYSGRHVITI
jgi:hypothetical protein